MTEPKQARSPSSSEELTAQLLMLTVPIEGDEPEVAAPNDPFRLAYIIYFFLGVGFLLPYNAFITAVDYFSYLYPAVQVDRVFSVAYLVSGILVLVAIFWWAPRAGGPRRVSAGLVMFMASLVVVPVVDLAVVKGRRGVYGAYWATAGAVVVLGVADALVETGVIGSAAEMPERFMQAVFAGTATSGVLVSAMRATTKAVYPHDPSGLRKSANLYFTVSIVAMAICLVCYNVAHKLPIVRHYRDIKLKAIKKERIENSIITGSAWRSTLWSIMTRIKWSVTGLFMIYAVTLSIFPGFITEDVHSEALKDWYPIMLITGCNVFDLIGKCLTAVYLPKNVNVVVGACFGRLMFYPLFYGCLHGPGFFRMEVPVTVLTCLLGLTNGYLTSVLMILTPKTVSIEQSEIVGVVMLLFLAFGLATGSIVSWLWVI